MSALGITFHPPRCQPFGRRIHHAIPGFTLLLAPSKRARLFGALLIASDWHDRHDWLRDLARYPR